MKHYTVKPSSIHGVGAFASRRLQAGELIDLAISYDKGFPGYNHSCNPNIMLGVANKPWTHDIVLKDVEKEEELTVRYPSKLPGYIPTTIGDLPCRCPACMKESLTR